MGYEDQLRKAERIFDKMLAARQPDDDMMKRLNELEKALVVIGTLCFIQLVGVAILVFGHLGLLT